jgi:hypothetical protein
LALRKLRNPAGNHPLPIERFDRSHSAQSTASNQSYASIQLRTLRKADSKLRPSDSFRAKKKAPDHSGA